MNRAGDSIKTTDLGSLVNLGAKNPMDSPKSDIGPRSIGHRSCSTTDESMSEAVSELEEGDTR